MYFRTCRGYFRTHRISSGHNGLCLTKTHGVLSGTNTRHFFFRTHRCLAETNCVFAKKAENLSQMMQAPCTLICDERAVFQVRERSVTSFDSFRTLSAQDKVSLRVFSPELFVGAEWRAKIRFSSSELVNQLTTGQRRRRGGLQPRLRNWTCCSRPTKSVARRTSGKMTWRRFGRPWLPGRRRRS
jgi:hypothetical protein